MSKTVILYGQNALLASAEYAREIADHYGLPLIRFGWDHTDMLPLYGVLALTAEEPPEFFRFITHVRPFEEAEKEIAEKRAEESHASKFGFILDLFEKFNPSPLEAAENLAAAQGKYAEATAPGLLKKAADIMEERGKQYDQPEGERSMGRAVTAFNAITGRDLQESEGWLLLQVLKDVRDRQRDAAHQDSLEDCIAYSALKAEARMGGK